jgi:dihydrodipicolinate synthase/N-acetylneuraminate lyase
MIGGVVPPAVTVVREDALDATATPRHMRRIVAAGVHGFCPGGSGG